MLRRPDEHGQNAVGQTLTHRLRSKRDLRAPRRRGFVLALALTANP
jgi:hypothetical protein